ncbi:MAG: hypothetical protein KGS61_01555 [Verrucomicrobia bacterium]|nr:hypothetical protein [Verrucomicrobiota bacterium]
MKIVCIADAETVRGFRLAGVAGQVVATPAEAVAAIEAAARQPTCGLIVLTETVAAGIREVVEAIRLERDRPLIVEVPGPEGPRRERKRLRQLAQEAVGIRVG